MKTHTLALLALLALSAPAAAGENLSAPVLLPAHEDQDAYGPCAAFGDGKYLVAWQSGRIAPGDISDPANIQGAGDIVACRVDASGKALDAKPVVVSSAKDLQERPKITFGEGVFLVVWQDLRNEKDYDVYAARVDKDGKCLDPDGIAVAALDHNQANPCVAFDGKTFLVAWEDCRSGKKTEIYGARVSTGGKVLDAEGLALGTGQAGGFHRVMPAAASAGKGKMLVIWVSASVSAGRGEPSGGVFVEDGKLTGQIAFKDEHHYKLPGGSCMPTIAAGPEGYLSSWRNHVPVGRSIPSREANACLFDASGKRSPSFTLTGRNQGICDPNGAWDGSAYLLAWHQQKGLHPRVRRSRPVGPVDEVYAQRVSQGGKKLGEIVLVAGTFKAPARSAAVASDGKGATLIAYEQHPETGDVPIKVGLRMLRAK